jgi:hypothetical protein
MADGEMTRLYSTLEKEKAIEEVISFTAVMVVI